METQIINAKMYHPGKLPLNLGSPNADVNRVNKRIKTTLNQCLLKSYFMLVLMFWLGAAFK